MINEKDSLPYDEYDCALTMLLVLGLVEVDSTDAVPGLRSPSEKCPGRRVAGHGLRRDPPPPPLPPRPSPAAVRAVFRDHAHVRTTAAGLLGPGPCHDRDIYVKT